MVSDFCTADDLTITPTRTKAGRGAKEEAVEYVKPHGYNCRVKSLGPTGTQSWDISRFTLERTYVPGDPKIIVTASYTDYVEFYYNNTATDNDWPRNTGWRQCLYMSDNGDDGDKDLDGTKLLDCSMSFEPFRLGFKFDYNTSTLTLNQAWTCDGIDAGHT